MKKLDKLILKSFIGPLVLTFCVSVFILLIQYMLKYFDDLVGKDLGPEIFTQLLLYFSIFMTPIALPLAILIASIMTYGNLGEHFELTAIKGSGISLTRTLLPTGILVLFISIGAYFSNNYVVPNAALRAYSLLYDIKHKKPSLDLREGQFYEGIPNYSIKVKKKYPNGIAMSDVIIYDHKGSTQGNKKVIIADSCRMYTIINDRYLMMELFNGNHYIEGENRNRGSKSGIETMTRTEFSVMKMAFSLASFDLDRTDMDLFAGNKLMKNIQRLTEDIDSMSNAILTTKYQLFKTTSASFRYHFNSGILIPEPLETAQAKQRKKQMLRDSIKMMLEDREVDFVDPDTIGVQNHIETQHPLENKAIVPASETEKSPNTKKESTTVKPTEEVSDSVKSISRIKALTLADKIKFKKLKDTRKVNVQPSTEKNKPTSSDKGKQGVLDKKKRRKNVAPKKEPTKKPLVTRYVNKSDTAFIENDSLLAVIKFKMDSVNEPAAKKKNVFIRATGGARTIKSSLSQKNQSIANFRMHENAHQLEKYKKYSQAVACFIMFLIGAPLGAIIKKGGLGMPVVVSVFFFIIFYVMTVISDKWAKASVMDGELAAWVADLVLLPFGIMFLVQARKDAKLFDADFYTVWWQNLMDWLIKKKIARIRPSNN